MFGKKLLYGVVVFILALGAVVLVDQYFTVQDIYVEGIEDLRGVESLNEKHMLFLDTDRVENELYSLNPSLLEINVIKDYPNELYIVAVSLRPIAQIDIADGSITVSANGRVIEKLKSERKNDLPRIQFYQPLYFNQFALGSMVEQDEITDALTFLNQMLDLGIAVRSIDITNENMIVLLTDDFEVVIASVEDISEQYEAFEYTYKQLQLQGQEYKHIDVRFEKPIIKLD